MTQSSLATRAVRGIGWSAVAQAGRHAVQVVVFLSLARILAPAEFGLIGMVFAITGFVTIVGELGIGAAIVQAKRLGEADRNAMFWLAIAMGVVITALLILLAHAVAAFYRQPTLVPLVQLVAWSFLFNGIAIVHVSLLVRELRFEALARAELLGVAAGGTAALLLALGGFGIWSLAWQPVISSAVTAGAAWRATGWRPALRFNLAEGRELFAFGWRLAAYNVSNYFVRNVDDILVGRFLGASALGIYGRAYALLMLPVTGISGVFGRAMLPTLSRLREDPDAARSAYLRALEATALIAFPLMLGLIAVADDFVLVLLGPAWAGMIDVLRILAALGMVQAVGSTTGWIFQSQGRADQQLRWGLIVAPVLVASFVVGIYIGSIEAVAGAYAVTSGVILLYPAFAYPGRLIGLRFSDVASRLLPVFACAAAMAGVVLLVRAALPGGLAPALRLLITVSVGAAVFVGIVRTAGLTAWANAIGALSLLLPQHPKRTALHERV